MSGPFKRNGISPSGIAVARVARLEGIRKIMEYLEGRGCLDADYQNSLAPVYREREIETLSRLLDETVLSASQEAAAELAEYEARALAHKCPKCPAQADEKCHDLRKVGSGYIYYVKHPHEPRMALAAAEEL